jgi:S-(hydroxymethyl)glutathione dehydrogenase/alcohol dehydrogenase
VKTAAAILTEQRHPLVVDEVEVPPLELGQVLVRIEATRICGSQIGEIDGVKGPDRWLPHLLGHEAGGTVLETGPGVRTVAEGDRVVVQWRPSDGLEAESGPRYRWGDRIVNAGHLTTFNRYGVISENRLTRVPVETDLELCCLLADTLTTGFGLVDRDAGLQIGESFVLFGSGGIGTGVLLGARLAGAHPIVAVDLHPHKLEVAKRLGATHVFEASHPDLEEAIRGVVGSSGADVVVDGTGEPEVIERCYRLARPDGRCVLFGVMRHERRVSLHTLPLHLGKRLVGSEGGRSRPHIDIPRYLRLLGERGIDLSFLVSHRGRLDEVNELIAAMRAGEAVHAIMHLGEGPVPSR